MQILTIILILISFLLFVYHVKKGIEFDKRIQAELDEMDFHQLAQRPYVDEQD